METLSKASGMPYPIEKIKFLFYERFFDFIILVLDSKNHHPFYFAMTAPIIESSSKTSVTLKMRSAMSQPEVMSVNEICKTFVTVTTIMKQLSIFLAGIYFGSFIY